MQPRPTKRLASPVLRIIMAFGLAISLGACDDDTVPGVTDGGKVGDGAKVGDGTKSTTDFPTGEGWLSTEGGLVRVGDGGVMITEDGGKQVVCYPTTCAGKLLACGNCKDDDGDGKVDWRDPECLGPCDNTEGPGLESGVGGTTGSQCGVDCYFDYGNGPGNDDCWWSHSCDPLEPELPKCEYNDKLLGSKKCPAKQSPLCAKRCLPYTPNGCDCFGCCTFPALAKAGPSGQPGYVWIGAMDASNNSTCTLASVTDPKKCPPSTPVPNCFKPCGKCQICVGKTTLPPECYPTPPKDGGTTPTDGSTQPSDGSTPPSDSAGPPPPQCPGGEQACGLSGQPVCPQGTYCITGCCITVVID